MGVGSGSLTVSDRKQSRLHCLLYKNIVKLLEKWGGVIGDSDFVFIFAKSKLPWGPIPSGRGAFICMPNNEN